MFFQRKCKKLATPIFQYFPPFTPIFQTVPPIRPSNALHCTEQLHILSRITPHTCTSLPILSGFTAHTWCTHILDAQYTLHIVAHSWVSSLTYFHQVYSTYVLQCAQSHAFTCHQCTTLHYSDQFCCKNQGEHLQNNVWHYSADIPSHTGSMMLQSSVHCASPLGSILLQRCIFLAHCPSWYCHSALISIWKNMKMPKMSNFYEHNFGKHLQN